MRRAPAWCGVGLDYRAFAQAFGENYGARLSLVAVHSLRRPRGPAVTWTDDRGFLDKPTDASTALTIIGAREYDPTTGRFISLDPVLESNSPQQLNGYTYAADNPVTQSDPSGLMPCADGICGSFQYLEHHVPSGGGGGGSGGGSSGICYYTQHVAVGLGERGRDRSPAHSRFQRLGVAYLGLGVREACRRTGVASCGAGCVRLGGTCGEGARRTGYRRAVDLFTCLFAGASMQRYRAPSGQQR